MAKSDFTKEIRYEIAKIANEMGLNTFCKKYETITRDAIQRVMESSTDYATTSATSNEASITDNNQTFTDAEITMIRVVINTYDLDKAVSLLSKLGHSYHTIYGWITAWKKSLNDSVVSSRSTAKPNIKKVKLDSDDENISIVVIPDHDYKPNEIHRPLYILELTKFIGFSQEEMCYFINTKKYNKNMLFRSDRHVVVSNLELIKKDSPLLSKKTIDYMQENYNHLAYAYRWCFLRPCGSLSAIEIFLILFNEALKMRRNDILNQEYLDVVTKGEDPVYNNDDGFVDKTFMLHPREASYNCFINNIVSRSIYRYKNYYDLTYNTEDRTKKLNKTVSEYITDIQNYITKNTIQNITGNLISEGKTAMMKDIVFPENGSGTWTHSVSICGRGGCGKTYQMINIIDEILSDFHDTLSKKSDKYKNIIPFYLALNDINRIKGNSIIQYVSESYGIKVATLKSILEEHRENIIIFCDGMNEVTNSNIRAAIARSILSLIAKYHTRIVISSRIDHGYLFNHSGISSAQKFVKAEVADLTSDIIQKYFKANLLYDNYKKLPLATQKLLKTAQGLSMYVALRKKESSTEFNNFGNLLETYVRQILRLDVFGDKTLEKVAYHMAREGKYKLHHIKLKKLLDDKSLNIITSDENVTKLFYMINGGFYQFSHQNFRDLYAALFIKDKVEYLSQADSDEVQELVELYFANNAANESEDILHICSDLFNSNNDRFYEHDTIRNAINVLRTFWKDDYSYCLSLLIKLYAYSNDNSIATLDLSHFDLTNVSLSNYKLYDLSTDIGCNFTGATICEDTFLVNGLQNGSSSICKYDYAGSSYIAAFSSTNVITYNINKNIWKCYRNYENQGWINCCCVTQLNGKTVVLLGTGKGHISVFDPETKRIELLIENISETQNSIQDIVVTYKSEKPVIFYSDKRGNVFFLNGDHGEMIRNSDEDEINHVKALYETKSINIFDKYLTFGKHLNVTSKMTVSTNGQYLYLSYGNSIYRYELPKKDGKEFFLFKRFDENTVVKDIMYTSKGILVNKLNEISYISDRGTEYKSYKVDNEESLEFFTKFSHTIDPEKVLIGVSARYSDYSSIENFFLVSFKYSSRKVAGEKVARGCHTKTTYTGVPFVSPQTGKQMIATVSDDRAVQIISPSEEDVDTIYHKGSYDGVREISFISENEIVLAQYDGSISIWLLENGQWECENIYNVHNDWVWNVKHTISHDPKKKFKEWQELWKKRNSSHIFSCSYDGTINKIDVITGKEDSSYPIRDLSQKPFIDLVVFDNGNSVIGITENDIYYKRISGKVIIKNIPKRKDWVRYILRSIENVDDKVFIALKATKVDGSESCFIYSWSDGKINYEMSCEKTCDFIAGIRIFDVQNNKFMIMYGNSGNSQYFAIYMLVENEWVYKGSTYPDDEQGKSHKSLIKLIDINDSEHYGVINDVAIWDKNRYLGSYVSKITFELYVVYKKCYYRAYEITIDTDQTIIIEKNQEEFTRLTISPHPSQPLCVDILNDTIVVGQLNGLVSTNNLNDVSSDPTDFLTHANLNAGYGIKLINVKYKSLEEEMDFKKHFNGYFDFG